MSTTAKGRPAKNPEKQKRLHYSVWVTEAEKKTIDILAQQAGLPASQFFLSQIIDKKIKTQRKKSWPNSIEPYALAIAKFSGMLSLLALKTKDRDMQQSNNWLHSSEIIKCINKLILLRVFEDFEFPQLKNTLTKIEEKSRILYWQCEALPDFVNRSEILGNINYLNKITGDLLSSFEKHYEESLISKTYQELWSAEMDVHQEIKKIKNELLKL